MTPPRTPQATLYQSNDTSSAFGGKLPDIVTEGGLCEVLDMLGTVLSALPVITGSNSTTHTSSAFGGKLFQSVSPRADCAADLQTLLRRGLANLATDNVNSAADPQTLKRRELANLETDIVNRYYPGVNMTNVKARYTDYYVWDLVGGNANSVVNGQYLGDLTTL